jgi:hypothetical protein
VCLLLLVLLGGANHVQEGTNVGHVRIILGVVEDFMPRCVCLIAGVAKWIVVIIFIVCPTCVFTHVVNVLLIDIVLTDIIDLIILTAVCVLTTMCVVIVCVFTVCVLTVAV